MERQQRRRLAKRRRVLRRRLVAQQRLARRVRVLLARREPELPAQAQQARLELVRLRALAWVQLLREAQLGRRAVSGLRAPVRAKQRAELRAVLARRLQRSLRPSR